MKRLWRENRGKNYSPDRRNDALATATMVPSMMVILGTSAKETAEQWFGSSPVMPFLNKKLNLCVTLQECLTDVAQRMSTIVDWVGNMIGVTIYLYNSANTELCIIQVLIDPLIGAIKGIEQLPFSRK
ncbi:MAG: hypothetical protein JWO73_822 [Candidatus Taylorbacteria bacterium]|nr:hypothetical protein [Candidatus Taylorbacteria bacterium]